ncbi:guanitoxin biosynthesis heme-dependent pre-guanitoxin N-hydroxylase GntA [Sphingomicrobium lutaoense]|uniref:YqcI/YcgG family protein n=1 Tax=Sphingomicrobium lutaoense TaxID=515949 RepID=A0A839Z1B7_9SPHN|nr:guanitoxin biosynthesis heme-dependent pre-guanitoxin N-hydroxylase GntA [Sphingomicrobium lutaoense]MBB3763375.1 hypothetical protein [Sphingomicrobium lutaoense]
MLRNDPEPDRPIVDRFIDFITDTQFPCVGAKAAYNRGGMHFIVARDFSSAWDDLRIIPELIALAQRYREDPQLFQSLVVLFREGAPEDEAEYEKLLWKRLESLSQKDDWLGQRPDPRVAHDPDDPHFALSFGGEAFFVVGLHPKASRPARRFDHPAIVFNLHDQFEKLREAGKYQSMRETILKRDAKIAGSINPMLAEHGSISAARQYSGRAVSEEWKCPFSGRKADVPA